MNNNNDNKDPTTLTEMLNTEKQKPFNWIEMQSNSYQNTKTHPNIT